MNEKIAELVGRERKIIEYRRQGLTFNEIAQKIKTKKPVVYRIYLATIKKLQKKLL
jgi:DNA-directed RNA polymerase specialized sigma subunit